jgi:hypothetical protein
MKERKLGEFVREFVAPRLTGFFQYERVWLVRITSIFLHGFLFERRDVEDEFYVSNFIDFLPSGRDWVGLIIDDRVTAVSPDGGIVHTFSTEHPEEQTELILDAVRSSAIYPYVANPSCQSILSRFDGKLGMVWAKFGLACCAILEREHETAKSYLLAFLNETEWLKDDPETRLERAFIEELLDNIDNIDWCIDYLWRRAEDTISLRKLEKVAQLSGWKRGH